MRKIKTWRDPYDVGFSTCRPKEIEIQDGLTILVGCNGAGKTTLLKNIKSELKNKNIPFHMYNNLHDGGSHSIGSALFGGNTGLAALMIGSSEGENISHNIGNLASQLREFIDNGFIDNSEHRLAEAFRKLDGEEKEEITSNERWILLDAIDSGFSVDNVIEAKNLFNLIIEDGRSRGKEVYIVVSANEYELANGEQCFDVMNGKYVQFSDYDDYKKFILHSREKKERRYK